MVILEFLKKMSQFDIILLFTVIIVVYLIIMNFLKISQLEKSESSGECICSQPQQQQTQQLSQIKPNNQNSNKPTLKLFYTEWCGFSKMFFPEWEKIKMGELKELVEFEQIDCVKSQNICNEYSIGGYPSIILIKTDKSLVNFPNNIERNEATVTNFVKKNI